MLGFGIFGGIYSLVEAGNEEVVQKIEYTNKHVEIRVPLYEKLAIN